MVQSGPFWSIQVQNVWRNPFCSILREFRTSLCQFGQIYSNLVHFDPFVFKMYWNIHFIPFCASLDEFVQYLTILDIFGPIWSLLIHLCPKCTEKSILFHIARVWTSLCEIGRIWTDMVQSGPFWSICVQNILRNPFYSILREFGRVCAILDESGQNWTNLVQSGPIRSISVQDGLSFCWNMAFFMNSTKYQSQMAPRAKLQLAPVAKRLDGFFGKLNAVHLDCLSNMKLRLFWTVGRKKNPLFLVLTFGTWELFPKVILRCAPAESTERIKNEKLNVLCFKSHLTRKTFLN